MHNFIPLLMNLASACCLLRVPKPRSLEARWIHNCGPVYQMEQLVLCRLAYFAC